MAKRKPDKRATPTRIEKYKKVTPTRYGNLPPLHVMIDDAIKEIQKSKVETYINGKIKEAEIMKKLPNPNCPSCTRGREYVNKNGLYYGKPNGVIMQKYRCIWCDTNFMKPLKPVEPAVIKQPEKPAVALAKTTLETQLEKKIKDLEKTIKTQQDRNDQNIRLKESLYKTEIDKREKLVKKLKTKIFKLEEKVCDLELERDGKIKFITDNPDFLEIT